MYLSFLERYGWVEPCIRWVVEKVPSLKTKLRKVRNRSTIVDESVKSPCSLWEEYKNAIISQISKHDILLIHASMDGLQGMHITPEQCMSFLKSLVSNYNCTIVMACFPITNLKAPTEKSRPYIPQKTICWTGILSNCFICDPDCIRTRFPYNSLAAIGPKAAEMMAKDLDAKYVYDKNSAWHYCYSNHAKVLFLGVKASGANTMAIHMIPDIMGDEWPIAEWYNQYFYKVQLNDSVITLPVLAQNPKWYKYVMEEYTSGKLKRNKLLYEQSIGSSILGVVPDCHKMIDFLVSEAKRGKLPYLIPKRYFKTRIFS